MQQPKMSGFYIFIEKNISVSDIKTLMKKLFPGFNFSEWDIEENIIDGVKDRELNETDVIFCLNEKPGLFKSFLEFYRFPNEKSVNRLDMYIAMKISNEFECKVTIDGYSFSDQDQLPIYSLMLENEKAYLIYDCYPEDDWDENDPRIAELKIEIIKEVNISAFQYNFGND